jgi:hypothetical protein
MKYFIDIETGPLSDSALVELMPPVAVIPDPPPFDPGSVAVGNMVDQAKIKAKIEAAEAAYNAAKASLPMLRAEKQAEAFRSFRDTAALSALTGRILLIVATDSNGEKVRFHDDIESLLLSRFWDFMKDFTFDDEFVGFNIRLFDVPFIIRRSLHFGIRVPQFILADMLSYRPRHILDLRDYWQLGDRQAPGSLASVCRFFGIPVKTDPSISGKNFHVAWNDGRRAQCLSYCDEDVAACVSLADAFNL